MKKIFIVFCIFTLIACEHSEGIQGTWNRKEKAINSTEYYEYSLVFNPNGTYQSETENKDIYKSSFLLLEEEGNYLFDGEYLHLYNRPNKPDIKFKVRLYNNQLWIYYNAGVIIYNR